MKCVVRNCDEDAAKPTAFVAAGMEHLSITISGLCRPHCDIVLRQGCGAIDIDVDAVLDA